MKLRERPIAACRGNAAEMGNECSPVFIGGIGGSGTRVFAGVFEALGYFMGAIAISHGTHFGLSCCFQEDFFYTGTKVNSLSEARS